MGSSPSERAENHICLSHYPRTSEIFILEEGSITLPSPCNSYVSSTAPRGALTGQAGGGFTFVLCLLSGGRVLAGFVFVAVV